MSTEDRLVHAVDVDGTQVVRYQRAGKWRIESPDGTRRTVAVYTAAVEASQVGWTQHYGLPGGSRFDTEVQRMISNREAYEKRWAGKPFTFFAP